MPGKEEVESKLVANYEGTCFRCEWRSTVGPTTEGLAEQMLCERHEAENSDCSNRKIDVIRT